jgi:hypothetical protein
MAVKETVEFISMKTILLLIRAHCFLLLVLVLIYGPQAKAIDIKEPARIRVQVMNSEGKPIQGAVVSLTETFSAKTDAPPIRAKSDVQGIAEIQMLHPHAADPQQISWEKELRVEADGMMAWSNYRYYLFPGGRFEETIVLQPCQTTLIRLRDASGRPVTGVNLSITEGPDNVFTREERLTDNKGEYLYVHPPVKDRLHIKGNTFNRVIKNAAEVIITLASHERPDPAPSSRLTGKVLFADGTPAEGWFITRDAKAT